VFVFNAVFVLFQVSILIASTTSLTAKVEVVVGTAIPQVVW